MSKTQWIVLASAAILFGTIYFGFDTSPDRHKIIEEQRNLAAVSTDGRSLLESAKESLDPQQTLFLAGLEDALKKATTDTAKAEANKQVSSAWYRFGNASIAGLFAEEVAKLTGTEESWSIAGTTFSICLQQDTVEKVRSFCTERAISALENAASLNPSEIQHKINLALVHVENPPKNAPMKGILALVELNKQYPDNVPVLLQLGRLAIKTGQFEKAIQRLEHAIKIDPDNPTANCLLAKAFEGSGDQSSAETYSAKCAALSGK